MAELIINPRLCLWQPILAAMNDIDCHRLYYRLKYGCGQHDRIDLALSGWPALRDQPEHGCQWKRRCSTADAPMGRSTKINGSKPRRGGNCRRFPQPYLAPSRRLPLLPLQATIPHLTRSSLHRCLQRHGISRLPDMEGEKASKKKFKTYLTGFFHIDIAEVRTEESKLYLFVAIDRTSKIAFARLVEKADTATSVTFLDALVQAIPYKINFVLT